VTSRRPDEIQQLRHLLRAGGLLDRWELVPIQGRTDRQTAEIMRESAIFLSLSDREGFGLPPAEAMACGCYVVGYSGLGGREFFDEEYCVPVPEGDLGALVRALHGACDAYESNPQRLEALGRQASERVLERYAQERLRQDLLEFYRPILDAGVPDAGPR
jgi:glycosyltransferase involved in cell wall biosynthesis